MVRVALGMVAAVFMADAAAAERWSGWRVGVHAGLAAANADYRFFDRGASVGAVDGRSDAGAVFGATGGYDRSFGGYAIGASVALERTTVDERTTTGTPGGPVETRTDFMWTARLSPRFSIVVGDANLYAEAGLAAAFIDQRITSPVGSIDDGSGHLGWTAAVGLEAPISERLSLVAELRLTDLSTFEFDAGRFSAETSAKVVSSTIGVAWRW